MPRRNRNACTRPSNTDELATETHQLADDPAAMTHKPLCAGCRANPAAGGGYCLPCKGQLILPARNNATSR